MRTSTRLIVSFIGDKDLGHFALSDRPVAPGDLSPIVRLLMHLAQDGSCGEGTRLMLFDDDRPSKDSRARFCVMLATRLPELGLAHLPLEWRKIDLPQGPTDLNALFNQVWSALGFTQDSRPDEVVFHLSSGTPAMQVTLLLAALCLPFDKVRLFETSREQGVHQVEPPYVLGLRERQRVRAARPRQLPNAARNGLLPDTVLDDPFVNSQFAALYSAARSRQAARVLILGPCGSGKWQAARQFAAWRGRSQVEWTEESMLGQAESSAVSPEATVLVRRLDRWSAEGLIRLGQWCDAHPAATVVATWRTDEPPRAPLDTVAHDGMRGAEQIHLPALGNRSDIVALAESLARQRGLWDTKLRQRLQYELLTDNYPHNLHDLAAVLAMTGSRSESRHPEREGYKQAMRMLESREALRLLQECHEILAGLRFSEKRTLDQVLATMRLAVVRYAQVGGRTQAEVAELLGCSQQAISDFLREEIDPRQWHSLRPDDEASPP